MAKNSFRPLFFGGLALLLAGPADFASASSFRCATGRLCLQCLEGQRTDDCFTSCNAFGGIQCLHPTTASYAIPDQPLETIPRQPQVALPLGSLHRFDVAPLGEAGFADLAIVLDWFWKYYDNPNRIRREPLDLAGSFLRDSEAVEFQLQVRSLRGGAVYAVTLEGKVAFRLEVVAQADSDELSLTLRKPTSEDLAPVIQRWSVPARSESANP